MPTTDTIKSYALRAARPHETRDRLLVSYGLGLTLLLILLTAIRLGRYGWTDFLVGVTDKLVAAVILAMIALVWYRLITPRSGFAEDLQVVEAWNIGPKLSTPLKTTRTYWFRGRSARWFRGTAVPKLLKAAMRDQVARDVYIILPDPTDEHVLRAYADHRNSLTESTDDRWTPDRIRLEILATILVAGKTATENRLLKSRVFLIPDFSVFRYDLTDSGLMMTREDKRLPGWFSPEGTRFYASVREDLRICSERGREVPLATPDWPKLAITMGDLQALVEKLGFDFVLSPDQTKLLHKAVKSTANPYD